jgi:hypothetical protein
MNAMLSAPRAGWAALAVLVAAAAGCNRPAPPAGGPADAGELPPAYLRNQITDSRLRAVAKEYTDWALGQRAGTRLFTAGPRSCRRRRRFSRTGSGPTSRSRACR